MSKRTFPLIACLLALALGLAACGDDDEDVTGGGGTTTEEQTTDAAPPRENVVQVAQANTNLSTLVEALTVAELAKTLEGPGPYTVFAPTNAAFEALGDGLGELLEPENREELIEVLTYHVVPGRQAASQLSDGDQLETIERDPLDVTVEGKTVSVNGAEAIGPEVKASNGIVYEIDEVLMP